RSFNPRPRVGGDVLQRLPRQILVLFQSAPPRGGRLNPVIKAAAEFEFQSAPPRGGRPGFDFGMVGIKSFTPRPRVGGDFGWVAARGIPMLFQSAPPRGGRRRGWPRGLGLHRVSIRAPAWGATPPPPRWRGVRGVSIRAP